MLKKGMISICVASLLATTSFGLDLKESVSEVLSTNPSVQERLKSFNEIQQDLRIARAEWLPSLDYTGSIGYNDTKRANDLTESYNQYSNSLRLTQNIFNGFATTNNISYQKSRILVAAHNYVENANSVAFQMVQAYIDVIRGYQLYQNALDNVKINEETYEDVKALFDTGLTTKSEMTKMFASLSLAKSNMLVQKNNARELELRFKRLLGREIDISSLTMPRLNVPLPESLERATLFAIDNNPSIIVGRQNIESSKYLYKQSKSGFYPSVNLSLEQSYEDNNSENTLFGTEEDRLTGLITLSWNLFRGGADVAAVQKGRSSIAREVEVVRDLKRQLIERLELSWTSYEMISNQLQELYQYEQYSQETLESYKSEYELGRRTLLDLLSAQQDLNNSKAEIINAQLDKLFAQYRILDSMGLLVNTVLGDEVEYNKVIDPTINPFVIRKDTLPIKLDIDNDGVVDSLDICDNSIAGDNIRAYGCVKKEQDSDFDGVIDALDKCPNTRIGDIVDAEGCTINSNDNKFTTNKEEYITPVVAYSPNSPEKSEKEGLYDYTYSTNIDKNVQSTQLDNHLMQGDFSLIKRFEPIFARDINEEDIKNIIDSINKYEVNDVYVTIIGNTRNEKNGYDRAYEYALEVKNALVEQGANAERLVVQSRINKDKLYLPTSGGASKLNNRVDVTLYVDNIEEMPEMLEENETIVAPVIQERVTAVQEETSVQKVKEIIEKIYPIEYINFENNSSYYTQYSVQRLELLREGMLLDESYDLIVTGHASKNGPTANANYDREISLRRALRVKEYFISQGIAANRIITIGKGHDEPIASNETKEGQAENRRVEIKMVQRQQ